MADVWRDTVRHIPVGLPVDPNAVAQADLDLDLRDNYLKARLDAADLGECLIRRGVPCDPAVLPDQPVAWNPTSVQLEKAVARLSTAGGALAPDPLSECLGLVLAKPSATTADVVLSGAFPTNLTNAGVPQPPVAGRYYLSGLAPGTLTRTAASSRVPVLYHDGQDTAYVLPQRHALLEAHDHLRFRLRCMPAGTPVSSDGRVTITLASELSAGWLPATHASFAGQAPTGAAFGYNLLQHPDLAAVWPPHPPDAASFWWDKGLNHVGATLIPAGRDGLIVADQSGIWWMSDSDGDVPWPMPWFGSEQDVPPNASTGPESPRLEEMRLEVSWADRLAATEGAMVTSLRVTPSSPLTLLGCDGAPATSGDLTLGLDLGLTIAPNDPDEGVMAVKSIAGTTLVRGPVVTSVRVGSGLVITSSHPRGDGGHYGSVLLDASASLAGRELEASFLRVFDVLQRTNEALDVLYLAFPPGRASKLVLAFHVPMAGLPTSPRLRFRLAILALASGTPPVLTLAARRIPLGSGVIDITSTTSAAVTLPAPASTSELSARTLESSQIVVTPGDAVYLAVTRAADANPAELGLLRVRAVLESGV